jgi:hypothetical protein
MKAMRIARTSTPKPRYLYMFTSAGLQWVVKLLQPNCRRGETFCFILHADDTSTGVLSGIVWQA